MSSYKLVVDAKVEIVAGCMIEATVEDSDYAVITVADGLRSFELALDLESMRALANASASGIEQMDALRAGASYE